MNLGSAGNFELPKVLVEKPTINQVDILPAVRPVSPSPFHGAHGNGGLSFDAVSAVGGLRESRTAFEPRPYRLESGDKERYSGNSASREKERYDVIPGNIESHRAISKDQESYAGTRDQRSYTTNAGNRQTYSRSSEEQRGYIKSPKPKESGEGSGRFEGGSGNQRGYRGRGEHQSISEGGYRGAPRDSSDERGAYRGGTGDRGANREEQYRGHSGGYSGHRTSSGSQMDHRSSSGNQGGYRDSPRDYRASGDRGGSRERTSYRGDPSERSDSRGNTGDRGGYRGSNGDRGGFRGSTSNRRGFRGSTGDRGGYRGSTGDRGSYRGSTGDRGGYRGSTRDRGGYGDSSRAREAYGGSSRDIGGYGGSSGNRGGYRESHGDRGGTRDYAGGRTSDRGGYSRGRGDYDRGFQRGSRGEHGEHIPSSLREERGYNPRETHGDERRHTTDRDSSSFYERGNTYRSRGGSSSSGPDRPGQLGGNDPVDDGFHRPRSYDRFPAPVTSRHSNPDRTHSSAPRSPPPVPRQYEDRYTSSRPNPQGVTQSLGSLHSFQPRDDIRDSRPRYRSRSPLDHYSSAGFRNSSSSNNREPDYRSLGNTSVGYPVAEPPRRYNVSNDPETGAGRDNSHYRAPMPPSRGSGTFRH